MGLFISRAIKNDPPNRSSQITIENKALNCFILVTKLHFRLPIHLLIFKLSLVRVKHLSFHSQCGWFEFGVVIKISYIDRTEKCLDAFAFNIKKSLFFCPNIDVLNQNSTSVVILSIWSQQSVYGKLSFMLPVVEHLRLRHFSGAQGYTIN